MTVIDPLAWIGYDRLAGDELRSILESNPHLVAAMTKGAGINVGRIRGLAAQGVIDNQWMLRAVVNHTWLQSEEDERRFADMCHNHGDIVAVYWGKPDELHC